jgi:hypothetical protein
VVAVAGPIAAITAGGYRIEVEELSIERSRLFPGVAPGSLYVFALVSPREKEDEDFALG